MSKVLSIIAVIVLLSVSCRSSYAAVVYSAVERYRCSLSKSEKSENVEPMELIVSEIAYSGKLSYQDSHTITLKTKMRQSLIITNVFSAHGQLDEKDPNYINFEYATLGPNSDEKNVFALNVVNPSNSQLRIATKKRTRLFAADCVDEWVSK